MRTRLLSVVLAAGMLTAPSAHAVPGAITLSGLLRTNGVAVDGRADMELRVYDDPTATGAGNLLFTDVHAGPDAVSVTSGRFTVHLGAGQAIPGTVASLGAAVLASDTLWVEIWVDGETLGDRIEVTSSAYAMRAKVADSLAGQQVTVDELNQLAGLAPGVTAASLNSVVSGGGGGGGGGGSGLACVLTYATCQSANCTATAVCPDDAAPVTGGYDLGSEAGTIAASHPTGNGWRIRVQGAAGVRTVYAQCCVEGGTLCGDGNVGGTEACDDGPGNGYAPDACRPNCQLPTCGDAIVDAGSGESCDIGDLNAPAPDVCRPDCTLPTCGDGIVDNAEQCDDVALSGAPGTCNPDCTDALLLQLSPVFKRVSVGEVVAFTRSGGFGAGTYSLTASPSGATIDPATGVYTAGAVAGVIDEVELVDSLGRVALASLEVTEALTQPLNLASGWSPYGAGYQQPSVTTSGATCVLSGLTTGTTTSNSLITTLPSHCRPDGRLIFAAGQQGNEVRVDVLANGEVRYQSGAAQSWVPLDGIVIVPSGGSPLETLNGWTPYGSGYRPPTAYKDGDLCVLSGLLQGSAVAYMANLPPECVPDRAHIFAVHQNGSSVRVDVNSSGVRLVAAAPNQWVPLDGINYIVPGPEESLTPLNGYSVYPGGGSVWALPGFTKERGLCVLSGLMSGSSTTTVGQLPEKCRPSGRLIFKVNQQSAVARVDVQTDGRISMITTGTSGWVPLDGIIFPADD